METPGMFLAFMAGLLSFFSPCVLAVAPGYLGMLAGTLPLGKEESLWTPDLRKKAMWGTGFFIIGFTMVFVLLGTAFSALGQLLFMYRLVFLRVGGIILILLGLFQWGILKVFTLQRDFRFKLKHRLTGPLGWLVTGASFAFGWTPCVGPILSMILVMAGSADRIFTGTALLLLYSLGMALPFFMLAVAFSTFYTWYKKLLPFTRLVSFLAGLLLISVGLLLLFDRLSLLSIWLNQSLGQWSLENLLK